MRAPRLFASRLLIAAIGIILVLGLGLLAEGLVSLRTTPPEPVAAVPSPASTSAAPCPGPWDCAQLSRFDAARAIIGAQPGHISIEVRDRTTGAVWQAGEPTFRIWAGSTPKLALAVALREQARAGQITLDTKANTQIAAMLSVSDNDAADALWNRYVHSAAMMTRFQQRYGMATAGYVTGFPNRWGFIKCTSHDLTNLMAYILGTLNPADRSSILDAMRSVGSPQQWGVWAAGPALQPGVKDGWSVEKDDGVNHWITATVGFVGPEQRYIVAAMYHQLPGGDTLDRGVHVLSDLVATVFGSPVPAAVVIPPEDA
jgi:hypothetical protein